MSSYIDKYTLGEYVSGIAAACIEAWPQDGRIYMRVEQGPRLECNIDRSILRDLVARFSYRIAAIRIYADKKYLVFGHIHPTLRNFVMIGSEQPRHSSQFEGMTSAKDGIGVPGYSVLMEFDNRIVAPAVRFP